MKNIPAKISYSFRKLEKIYGRSIDLKLVNGKFCIFEVLKTHSPKGRRNSISLSYIGWITNKGALIPAKPEFRGLDVSDLETFNGVPEPSEPDQKNLDAYDIYDIEVDGLDLKILKILSMNSRLAYPKISKLIGTPVNTVKYRIKKLKKELGIKDTLELNTGKLGFSNYLIAVKFLDQKPEEQNILKATSKNPRVQLVLLTKSIYDLLIFCLAENSSIIESTLDEIRGDPALRSIRSEWYVTSINPNYGFLPLRQEFFDILINKASNGSMMEEKLCLPALNSKEYKVLYELNIDGRKEFKSIDQKYNLPAGSSKKAYSNLINDTKKNLILRPTIIMRSIPKIYDAVIIAKVIDKAEFIKHKDVQIGAIDKPETTTDKFSYICDIGIPDGILYLFSVINDRDLEEVKNEIETSIKGVELESLIIEKNILGDIGYRRFVCGI
ncbi:Lrp-AsnC family transcriptional regulator [Candidatus Mancarchaeum acidiphilum]|uniref:Lrp-AsnC family transcriptional regulator n=1 Tax=Candidatus Mancarchaeum acidiphilum TaxID=1920749 RepID=A0A218NNK1_9ARCH|nr:AsnC family transcriptional regulator [Candidatus Mancarchaeum acidiphilum]ASI14058.1 Lrp-AsnC family transcriptional regulator [Candidatus Mancarchaeum acidiphilum]